MVLKYRAEQGCLNNFMEARTQFLHYTLIIIWSLQKLFLFQNKCFSVVKGRAVTSQTNLNVNLGHWEEVREDGEMLSKYSNVTRLRRSETEKLFSILFLSCLISETKVSKELSVGVTCVDDKLSLW